jgi:hypothetical protein
MPSIIFRIGFTKHGVSNRCSITTPVTATRAQVVEAAEFFLDIARKWRRPNKPKPRKQA